MGPLGWFPLSRSLLSLPCLPLGSCGQPAGSQVAGWAAPQGFHGAPGGSVLAWGEGSGFCDSFALNLYLSSCLPSSRLSEGGGFSAYRWLPALNYSLPAVGLSQVGLFFQCVPASQPVANCHSFGGAPSLSFLLSDKGCWKSHIGQGMAMSCVKYLAKVSCLFP